MRVIDMASLVMLAYATVCSAQSHFYGAVDIGSRATKGSLYSFVSEEEGLTPVVIFSKAINTTLVSSMKDGAFTPDGIADATSAVTQVVDAMKAEAAKQSVNVDVYYIVGSSGVARASNKPELVEAVKQPTGITMDFVDAAHEGYYELMSAVPRNRSASSMYVDIGSGNAKLGCLVGDADFSNFRNADLPYGSVSSRHEALKRTPNDLNAGIASVMTDVSTSYEQQSRDIPCLRDPRRIYWTGGAAWAIATFTHPEREMNNCVTITKHDLDTFLVSLKDSTWNQKKPVLVFPENMPLEKRNAIRAKAAKARDDVQNVFLREDLLSGVSIMQAILNSRKSAATMYFVRNGSFIYGYVLAKYGEALLSSSAVSTSAGRAVAQLSHAQIHTLETATIRLHAQANELKALATSTGRTDSYRLRSRVEQVLVTSLEALDATEARIHAEGFPTKVDSANITADEPDRVVFDDLRLNYQLLLKQLDVTQNVLPWQSTGPMTPVSFPVMGSAAWASGDYSALVQESLDAIADNELAYTVAADSSSLTFDLRLYSTPEGATIEYKRRGDKFKMNSENTNSTITSLTLAIWIVHVYKDGYQDQEIEHDPFRQREHRIDVVLRKRGR